MSIDLDLPAWARDAIFYQVFPDRLARSGRVPAPGPFEPWDGPPTTHGFKGGDLRGVIAHLDRLRALGITALYLNPVFASASNHRYHTDDYFHVDPLLGGDEALADLLEEAHGRDMRIVLDGVFNHCGRGFWPFHHVLENGARSPYRDWFHLDPEVLCGQRPLTAFPGSEELSRIAVLRASGAPSGSASRSVLGYEAWWDLAALPKLDLEEPHLRALILDVAEHWLRIGIDGWRLDVAEEIGIDFWRAFRARVRAVRPDAYLVAEIWRVSPDWLAGDTFDALMDYPLAEAILGFAAQHRLATGIDLPWEYQGRLVPLDAAGFWGRLEAIRSAYGTGRMAVQLNMLGSHDTPRLRTLCGGDLDAVRLAMLLQLTLPGTPCVYYGDEIGMEGLMDPDCRRAFPADPRAWREEPSGWLADLAALRHGSRALRDGELLLLRAEGAGLAYLRRQDDDAFACLLNAADEDVAWHLDLPLEADSVETLELGGQPSTADTQLSGTRSLDVGLPARRGAIVRLRPG
jgi:neopullulanase